MSCFFCFYFCCRCCVSHTASRQLERIESTLVPNYYTLRHGGNYKADSLRTWDLQGESESLSVANLQSVATLTTTTPVCP
jgi:hypothetical protein